MEVNFVRDIRREFRRKKAEGIYRGNTIDIQNAQFIADLPTIFGERNEEYIKAEIEWYESESLHVGELFNIYGKPVKIWNDISDPFGRINSNYGWCVFSKENKNQFSQVLHKLARDQETRQAVMIYTRPDMHYDWNEGGRKDFMCTNTVQYFLNKRDDGFPPYMDCQVNMRSNDAIFGFINDFAWQQHVLELLSWELLNTYDVDSVPGTITWNVGSLHIYDRHYSLID